MTLVGFMSSVSCSKEVRRMGWSAYERSILSPRSAVPRQERSVSGNSREKPGISRGIRPGDCTDRSWRSLRRGTLGFGGSFADLLPIECSPPGEEHRADSQPIDMCLRPAVRGRCSHGFDRFGASRAAVPVARIRVVTRRELHPPPAAAPRCHRRARRRSARSRSMRGARSVAKRPDRVPNSGRHTTITA